jgi:hypothetical protein
LIVVASRIFLTILLAYAYQGQDKVYDYSHYCYHHEAAEFHGHDEVRAGGEYDYLQGEGRKTGVKLLGVFAVIVHGSIRYRC